jgi:hypothetical protein
MLFYLERRFGARGNHMKNNNSSKYKYMKMLAVGLALSLCLLFFAGCTKDNGDTSDNGTTGTVTEDQTKGQGTDDGTTGQDDQDTNDGTNTGSGETSSNDGTTSQGDTDSTTGDNTGSDTPTTPATPESTCTIQINCALLVGKTLTGTGLEGMESLVPANGVILPTTKVTLNPGDTVYDLTLRVVKAQKIHMATVGSQATGTLYVSAIANIYEKAYNSKSGWVYLINGTKPGIGSGVQKLKAGDALVWAYSLNLGNDL